MDIQSYAKYQHGKIRDEILQSLCKKYCCVLLGFPGSGKTVMTADLIKTLICDHHKKVAVTGSTGSAAQQIKSLLPEMNLSVQTIHSFLGYSAKETNMIDKGNMNMFDRHIKQQMRLPWKQQARETMNETDILIVDEMSMLTGEFIYGMDITLRAARRMPSKRFGGITLFLIGDFRQLPPVSNSAYQYSFLHPNWESNKWFDKIYVLEFILRQSGDIPYSEMILRLSHNALTHEDLDILRERVVSDGRNKIMDVSFLPDALRVFHTNKEVNMYNDAITEKAALEGRNHVMLPFKMDVPKQHDMQKELKQLQNDMVYSKEIFVGSSVIITANMDVGQGIVNGTMGKVVQIEQGVSGDTPIFGGRELSLVATLKLDDNRIIKVGNHTISATKDDGKKTTSYFPTKLVVKAHYIPLLLSHAITVHRLQGSTIRRPLFYMPRMMARYCREFYVIATRVTSLDYLYLTELPHNLTGVMDPMVIDMYHTLFKQINV